MVITGQATLHAWMKKNQKESRIVATPVMFVRQLGWTAGTILSQMLYWTDQSKSLNGEFFHTHRQWQEELCMSEWDVKRGLGDLRRKGLIETYIKRIGVLTKTFFRVIVNRITEWWNSPTPIGGILLPGQAEFSYPYIDKMKDKMKGKDETSCASGEPGNPCVEQSEEKESSKEDKGVNGMVTDNASAHEDKAINVNVNEGSMVKETSIRSSTKGKVLQSATTIQKNVITEKAKPIEVPSGNLGVQDLMLLWSKLIPRYTSKKFVANDPIGKTQGQFKLFAKRCSENHKPDGKVLAAVVKSWIEFTKRVQVNKGLYNAPLLPDIGFLLLHFEEAVEYYLMLEKQKVNHSKVAVATPSTMANAINCNGGLIVGKHEYSTPSNVLLTHQPATLEEIDAINKKLFGGT